MTKQELEKEVAAYIVKLMKEKKATKSIEESADVFAKAIVFAVEKMKELN